MPAPLSCRAVVAEHIQTEPGFYRILFRVPKEFPDPTPGQFVHLSLSKSSDPLLPRPYGIVDFRRTADEAYFELYYGVVGSATRLLAAMREGEECRCLGPLGRGYRVDPDRGAILVAGGRGVAPLLMVYAEERKRRSSVPFVYGFRTARLNFGMDRIAGPDRHLATDDGSLGRKGNALDVLKTLPADLLESSTLYACGPEILLEKTAEFAIERGIPCQVSMETPFACGVGICRGCAVPAAGGPGYLMCCSDGPVFDAVRIDWDRVSGRTPMTPRPGGSPA